jgi:3-oxoadipate enol-lactonase
MSDTTSDPTGGSTGGEPLPVELAAIERGAGPAVTLVHGGIFHSGPAWSRTIGPLVEAGYRVLAVDRRGYGRSPDGDVPGSGAVGVQAEDVAATLRLRGVTASHVVGVSYGAMVALELALRHPDLTTSLTLVEPTVFSLLEDDPDYAEWIHRFAELDAIGRAGSPHELWLSEWLDLMDPAMARGLQPGSRAWPLVEEAFQRRRREESILRYRPDPGHLRSLQVPTLVVNGSDSEPALHAVGDLLADLIPAARHAEVAEAGHQLHAERPEAFNELLLAFLFKSLARFRS